MLGPTRGGAASGDERDVIRSTSVDRARITTFYGPKAEELGRPPPMPLLPRAFPSAAVPLSLRSHQVLLRSIQRSLQFVHVLLQVQRVLLQL